MDTRVGFCGRTGCRGLAYCILPRDMFSDQSWTDRWSGVMLGDYIFGGLNKRFARCRCSWRAILVSEACRVLCKPFRVAGLFIVSTTVINSSILDGGITLRAVDRKGDHFPVILHRACLYPLFFLNVFQHKENAPNPCPAPPTALHTMAGAEGEHGRHQRQDSGLSITTQVLVSLCDCA